MPLRSTIDVSVEAAQLNASVAALSRFVKEAEKSDTLWNKYGTQAYAAQRAAGELQNMFQKQNATLFQSTNIHNRFSQVAGTVGKTFAALADNTKSIATNLARTAVSFLDIMTVFGIVGGLVGLGTGLFGVDALAHVVSARRKAAMRLGAGYGANEAFNLNFSRIGDPGSMLSATSEGLYNVTSPAYLALLNARVAGANAQGGSTTESMVNLLQSLPKLFAGTPEGMIGPRAEALHLTDIMSVKEIVTYLHMSPEERDAQIRHFRVDSITLNISAESQQKWADFSTSLTRAGVQIETVLGDKLTTLADPLDHLSDSVVKVIDALSKSMLVTGLLDKMEGGLNWFIGEISSPAAKTGFRLFLSGMDALIPASQKLIDLTKSITPAYLRLMWSLIDPDSTASRYASVGDYIQYLLGASAPPATGSGYTGPFVSTDPNRAFNKPPSIRRHTRRYVGLDTDTPASSSNALFTFTPSAVPNVPTTGLAPVEGDSLQHLVAHLQRVYPTFSTQQCVELAFKMSGIPYTPEAVKSITRGPSALDPNIPAGTPVSTFFNEDRTIGEHYAAGGTGTPGINRDHMGIKMGTDAGGNLVLMNQWSGQTPTETLYAPGRQPGTEKDAASYFAVMGPDGLPAGTFEDNPYRRQVLANIAAQRFAGGAQGIDAYQQKQKALQRRQQLENQKQSFLDTLQGAKKPKATYVVDATHSSTFVTQNRSMYG